MKHGRHPITNPFQGPFRRSSFTAFIRSEDILTHRCSRTLIMDYYSSSRFTSEAIRLSSFQRTPLPNHRKLSITNSPAKFAKAGFFRSENALQDDVTCEYCGITYGEWSGESPYAVHRVLGEHCLFLSRPASTNPNHPRASLEAVRRRLFPASESTEYASVRVEESDDTDGNLLDNERDDIEGESDATDDDMSSLSTGSDRGNDSIDTDNSSPQGSSYVSLLSPQTAFDFPFEPRQELGGSSMLFASRRLKTFTEPRCPECVEWAEEGFVYRRDSHDVQCIFCEVILPYHCCEPKQCHKQKSGVCPRVLCIDVGNISMVEEERIKLKNLQRQLRRKSPQGYYAVHHPQYENEDLRLGTFENWPPLAWQLEPAVLCSAGFFYTGCADKVRCYSCGLGLFHWRNGSEPWEQHALHMPSCPHLQAKGQDFIEQAALAQALTEADMPSDTPPSSPGSASSSGQLVTSPPGVVTLDTCAVTAALSTSRFPTKDILLGTLRAADENFTTVCQQRHAIHQKDSQLQQKDSQLQQQSTQLQQQSTQLQQQSTQLQQQVGLVEQHSRALQEKDEVIQQHREELQMKEDALRMKEEEMERKNRQMRYKDLQIESLRAKMEALLQERRQAGLQAAPLQPAAVAHAVHQDDDNADEESSLMYDISCKVCRTAESNTLLRPCHHITCCSTCASRLDTCPVCRAPIREMLPTFFS